MQDVDVGQATLPAGFQFGAYVIGSCIGQGGMARIYRAEHRVLRKPVALKVMESVLLERPEGRPRFLREGQAAAAVKHPNVVDITDVGVWQGRPYLVMELLEGEDLEQYLSRHKPLSEQEVARIMIPVIAGLVTAHAAGVVHRDLKPSNVFLSRGPDGEIVPKLLDFGISKLESGYRAYDPSSTPIGELMGSPMYMSPEAVRGARDLGPQSDQYSLGVILYECVTGRPPFYGDSLLSVLEAVASGRYESPRRYRPDLSTVIEVAISRSMSREPTERFPSVRELGRALCEAADQRTRLLWTPSFGVREPPLNRSTPALGSAPSRAASTLSSASVPRRRQRAPLWPLSLAALALMLLALVVVAYVRMPLAPYAGIIPSEQPNALRPAPGATNLPHGEEPALPVRAEQASAALREPLSPPHAEVSDAPVEALAVAPSSRQRAPDERPARPPAAAAARPSASVRPAAAARPAASPRSVPPERSVASQPNAAPGDDDDEDIFPVRPPAPTRHTPVLGANQSPILD